MSGKFLSPLYCVRQPDGKSRLTRALVFESAIAGYRISVPRDFVTDFASVPRLPFAYLLFGGVADEAAVVHDYVYSKGMFDRQMCDAIFREAMAACGQPGWRRWPMWLGVRLFGASHYSLPANKF
jgi:hypothetical protein